MNRPILFSFVPVVCSLLMILESGAYPFDGPHYISTSTPSSDWLVVGDFNNDGRDDVLAPLGSVNVRLYKNDNDKTFSNVAGAFPALPGPLKRAVAGDFDNDGDLDVFAVGWGMNNSLPHHLFTFVNDGTGHFTTLTDLDFHASLPLEMSLAAADLDRNGTLDVIYGYDLQAGGANNAVVVWRKNNGNATFQAPSTLENAFDSPSGVAAEDFDRDGDPDLVLASRNNSKIGYYKQTAGLFGAADYIVNPPGDPVEMYAANVNGDARLELIILAGDASFVEPHTIRVSNQMQDGLFHSGLELVNSTTTYFSSVIPVDADEDGDLDIVAAAETSAGVNSLQWLRKNGAFEPLTTLVNLPGEPTVVRASDFDRDGDSDLVVLLEDGLVWVDNRAPHAKQFWGTSGNFVGIDFPQGDVDFASGDLGGDMVPDLVVASPDFRVRRIRMPNGQMELPELMISLSGAAAAVALPDLMGTPMQEVMVAATDENELFWSSQGQPDLPWPQRSIGKINAPRSLAVVDVNRDGDLDAISGSTTDGTIVYFENTRSLQPMWPAQTIASGLGSVERVWAGHSTPGGAPEVFALTRSGNQAQLVLISWDGQQWSSLPLATGQFSGTGLVGGDFERDGHDDIAVTLDGETRLYRFGPGPRKPAITISGAPNMPTRLLAHDFEKDGDPDLMILASAGVFVAASDGNGGFAPAQSVSAEPATGVGFLDTSEDGFVDLFAGGHAFNSVAHVTSHHAAVRVAHDFFGSTIRLLPNTTATVMTIEYTHLGWPGDAPIAPATFHLGFSDTSPQHLPLTSVQIGTLLNSIAIYRDDDRPGALDPGDPLLASVTPAGIGNGALDIAFSAAAQNLVEVGPGQTRRLVVVFDVKGSAAGSAIDSFRLTHRMYPGLDEDIGFGARGGMQFHPVPTSGSSFSFEGIAEIGQPTPIELWREVNWGVYGNGGVADNKFDYDGDGIPNLIEYVFGTDPLNQLSGPASGPVVDLVGNKPRVSWKLSSPPRPDVTVRLERSDDLKFGSWTMMAQRVGGGSWSGPVPVVAENPGLGGQTFRLTDPTSYAGKPGRFYRLEVEE